MPAIKDYAAMILAGMTSMASKGRQVMTQSNIAAAHAKIAAGQMMQIDNSMVDMVKALTKVAPNAQKVIAMINDMTKAMNKIAQPAPFHQIPSQTSRSSIPAPLGGNISSSSTSAMLAPFTNVASQIPISVPSTMPAGSWTTPIPRFPIPLTPTPTMSLPPGMGGMGNPAPQNFPSPYNTSPYPTKEEMSVMPKGDMEAMGGMFESLEGAATKVFAIMAIGTFLKNLVSAMFPFGGLITMLTTIFSTYGAIIGTSFTPLIEGLFTVLLSPEVLAMVEQLSLTMLDLFTAMLPLGVAIAPIGIALMEALIPALNTLLPIFPFMTVALVALTPTLVRLIEILGTILTPIIVALGVAFVVAIWAFDLFYGAINVVFGFLAIVAQGLTDLFQIRSWADVGNFFINIIAGIWNIIASAINTIIDVIDVLDVISWRATSLPMLAAGGIVTRPTIAMIGEAGPEAVVPLNESNNYNRGGATTIIINGDVTDEHLYKMQREIWLRSL